MEQVYTRLYSDDARNGGVPRAQPSITIGAGKQRCTTVKFPAFGRITELSVKQASGTNVAFTVELLNSKFPFTPDVDQTAPATPNDELEMYRAVPKQTGTSGNAVELDPGDTGYPFRNMDGGYTDQQNFIYLVIIPTASPDASTWDARITCVQDNG